MSDLPEVSELPGFSSMQAPARASAIELYARPSADFAAKLDATIDLLRHAAQDHRGSIVQATSLGAEDMVVTDLIARLHLASRSARWKRASCTRRRRR